MQTNIGFDFGTHQTKICAEQKDYNYCKYQFLDFVNTQGEVTYVLPSLIKINNDGMLEYGYFNLDNSNSYRIVRYFKQATFNYLECNWEEDIEPKYFSIWYIANLLFDIIDKLDPDTLVTGVPTDSTDLPKKKAIAVSLFASAFHLVEDVFYNDKEGFLNTPIDELMQLTEIVPYSYEVKKQYGLFVIPEAYACLKPLLANSRLKESNMSLMIDIGGGTTDISFFTTMNNKPKIYKFLSIPKGLNYLTGYSTKMEQGVAASRRLQLIPDRIIDFNNSIKNEYKELWGALKHEFLKYPNVRIEMLESGMKNRPVIFTGGGSTFMQLRKPCGFFSDVRLVSMEDWKLEHLERIPNMREYCPVLSTAYGLSIGITDDSISMCSLTTLFSGFKNYVADDVVEIPHATSSYSYKDNWRTKEYGVLNLGGGSYSVPNRKQEKNVNHSSSVARTLSKKDSTSITSVFDIEEFISKRRACNTAIGLKKIKKVGNAIKDTGLRNQFYKMCEYYNKSLGK